MSVNTKLFTKCAISCATLKFQVHLRYLSLSQRFCWGIKLLAYGAMHIGLYIYIYTCICIHIYVHVYVSYIYTTGSEAHPASCTMGTGSFPGVKRSGRGVDHPPPSSAEVKERVALYFYSPSGPSWPVLGWTFYSNFSEKAASCSGHSFSWTHWMWTKETRWVWHCKLHVISQENGLA